MSHTEHIGVIRCIKNPCPDRLAGLRHATIEQSSVRDSRAGAENSVSVMMLTFSSAHHDVSYMSRVVGDWTSDRKK